MTYTEKEFSRDLNELYWGPRWVWWRRLRFELLWLLGIKT